MCVLCVKIFILWSESLICVFFAWILLLFFGSQPVLFWSPKTSSSVDVCGTCSTLKKCVDVNGALLDIDDCWKSVRVLWKWVMRKLFFGFNYEIRCPVVIWVSGWMTLRVVSCVGDGTKWGTTLWISGGPVRVGGMVAHWWICWMKCGRSKW